MSDIRNRSWVPSLESDPESLDHTAGFEQTDSGPEVCYLICHRLYMTGVELIFNGVCVWTSKSLRHDKHDLRHVQAHCSQMYQDAGELPFLRLPFPKGLGLILLFCVCSRSQKT